MPAWPAKEPQGGPTSTSTAYISNKSLEIMSIFLYISLSLHIYIYIYVYT